ncbi:MAG TPA: YciI family protein, partial [Candidatus Dormibacteraeota bacterium]
MLRGRVEFERLTISLLMLRPDAVQADDAAAAAQQDAHLSHLADLHQAGELLAVGPVLGPPDRVLRGLGVYRAEPERVRLIGEEDPGVRAGRYSVVVAPWMIPGGAITFATTRVPRSIAEAQTGIQFDRFSIALLVRGARAAELDGDDGRLQDAHMAHLADLHQAGHLLAAGPISDKTYRGLSILRVEPDRARELKEED